MFQKIEPSIRIVQEKEIADFARARLDAKYFDTQLSLISQELAFLSDFFFYSNPSTWSANVVLERLAANVFGERMILDLVKFNPLKTQQHENKEENSEIDCKLYSQKRLGKKNEFGIVPLVSLPGSGNT